MGRLSQRDLIDKQLYEEGIGSMLKRAAQTGLERAVKVGKGIGTALAPKTAAELSKLGKAVSSDFVKVMGANPKNGLRSWLNTPEGMRLFKTVSLGGEKKLQNNDVDIQFKGQYIDPKTPDEAIDKAGFFRVRPGGENNWGIIGASDNDTPPNVIWSPSRSSLAQFQKLLGIEGDGTPATDPTPGGTGPVPPVPPERPERPEAPERPERPEAPERPERPEAPERPERPKAPKGPDEPSREIGGPDEPSHEIGGPDEPSHEVGGPDEPSHETVSTPGGVKGAFKTYKDAIKGGAKRGLERAVRDRGMHPDQLVKKADDYLRDRGLQPGQVGQKTSDWVDDKLDGEDPNLPPPLPKEPPPLPGAPVKQKRDYVKEYARSKVLKAQKEAAAKKRSEAAKQGARTRKIRTGVNAARAVPKEGFSQKELLQHLTLLSR